MQRDIVFLCDRVPMPWVFVVPAVCLCVVDLAGLHVTPLPRQYERPK